MGSLFSSPKNKPPPPPDIPTVDQAKERAKAEAAAALARDKKRKGRQSTILNTGLNPGTEIYGKTLLGS